MSKAMKHLYHARAALTAFEPTVAEDSLRKFEIALNTDGLALEETARCKIELSAIRDLAKAAQEGVAAAQHQFREILDLTRRLDTYDKAGQRQAEQVAPVSARKF